MMRLKMRNRCLRNATSCCTWFALTRVNNQLVEVAVVVVGPRDGDINHGDGVKGTYLPERLAWPIPRTVSALQPRICLTHTCLPSDATQIPLGLKSGPRLSSRQGNQNPIHKFMSSAFRNLHSQKSGH